MGKRLTYYVGLFYVECHGVEVENAAQGYAAAKSSSPPEHPALPTCPLVSDLQPSEVGMLHQGVHSASGCAGDPTLLLAPAQRFWALGRGLALCLALVTRCGLQLVVQAFRTCFLVGGSVIGLRRSCLCDGGNGGGLGVVSPSILIVAV